MDNKTVQIQDPIVQNPIVQMYDKDILVCEDTWHSFLENNQDDEDVLEGVWLLRHFDEVEVATGQGVFTLKIKS